MSGSETMWDAVERFYGRLNRLLGRILSLVLVLMTCNVFYDVIMRYTFHNSSVGMQEMEWHLFSIIILFGISVALLDEAHVRVDFLYDRFSEKTRAIINIVGTLLFLLPLASLIFFGSFEFVRDAWEVGEISEDPGGLPYRWLIKAMIPLAFGLLILVVPGYVVKNINLLRRSRAQEATGKTTVEERASWSA
ncbi:MAG: TRAP transporter small permease subunit [Desulfopila sp.]